MATTRANSAVEKIRAFAAEGLTNKEISTRVGLSAQTVSGLCLAHNLRLADGEPGRKRLTEEEADALREQQAQIYASGPQMGVCVACGFWRRLNAEGRLPAHDYGPAACRGSGRLPMRNPIDD